MVIIQNQGNLSLLFIDPRYRERATELFSGLGVQIVSGSRFLGGYIGDKIGTATFVRERVQMWLSCINRFALAAETQPQAAFASLSKSLQCE